MRQSSWTSLENSLENHLLRWQNWPTLPIAQRVDCDQVVLSDVAARNKPIRVWAQMVHTRQQCRGVPFDVHCDLRCGTHIYAGLRGNDQKDR